MSTTNSVDHREDVEAFQKFLYHHISELVHFRCSLEIELMSSYETEPLTDRDHIVIEKVSKDLRLAKWVSIMPSSDMMFQLIDRIGKTLSDAEKFQSNLERKRTAQANEAFLFDSEKKQRTQSVPTQDYKEPTPNVSPIRADKNNPKSCKLEDHLLEKPSPNKETGATALKRRLEDDAAEQPPAKRTTIDTPEKTTVNELNSSTQNQSMTSSMPIGHDLRDHTVLGLIGQEAVVDGMKGNGLNPVDPVMICGICRTDRSRTWYSSTSVTSKDEVTFHCEKCHYLKRLAEKKEEKCQEVSKSPRMGTRKIQKRGSSNSEMTELEKYCVEKWLQNKRSP